MGLTIAEVSHPNGAQTNVSGLAPFKGKVVDVTFDNAYDNTNGELLTAAALGWNGVFGALVLGAPWSGTTTDTMLDVRITPNAAQTQLSLRLAGFDGDATGDPAAFTEMLNNFDASAFTCRLLVLGY